MTRDEYAEMFRKKIAEVNASRAMLVSAMSDLRDPNARAIAAGLAHLSDTLGLVICELAHHRLKDQES